ncbi:MAG: hypothetical protein KGK18_13760, partial [Burkholderiales bacterium]|nr:hypothetical protein [Burkholderiales bacterium]
MERITNAVQAAVWRAIRCRRVGGIGIGGRIVVPRACVNRKNLIDDNNLAPFCDAIFDACGGAAGSGSATACAIVRACSPGSFHVQSHPARKNR